MSKEQKEFCEKQWDSKSKEGIELRINKDIESYKSDFIKGLTVRESIYGGIAVSICVLVTLFLNWKMKLPMTAAVYVSLPIAVPFALTGFIKINKMTFPQYMKKVIAKKLHPLYLYKAEEVVVCKKEEKQRQEEEEAKKRKIEREEKKKEQAACNKRKIRTIQILIRKSLRKKRRKGELKRWHLAARNLKNVKK